MRRVPLLLIVGLAGLLAGCGVRNLEEYYTPESGQAFAHTDAVAIVDGGQDAEAAYKSGYENRGYVRIGRVSFVGQKADDTAVADFGKRIGADVVVVSRRYVGSRVVDNPSGPAYGMGPTSAGSNLPGGNAPMFDPSFTPEGRQGGGPDSYVVRDFRTVAIYLRRG